MGSILFFSIGVDFNIKQKGLVRNWINSLVASESFHVKQISFIFCDDNYLLEINRQYLSHDYYTDIITFDYSSLLLEKRIESDVYISLDRVLDNSKIFGVTFTEEFYRVMSHGVLHLLGYKDKSRQEIKTMRLKESEYTPFNLFHVKQKYK